MPAPELFVLVFNTKAAITLAILAATMASFVREKFAPEVTSLLAVLALLLTGILGPAEAFSGFSHPATISVCAMIVLTAGLERSGALIFVARRVLSPLGRWESWLTLTVMLVTALLSAFVVNTAVVAVFIPVLLDVCRRTGANPGRILMPMAHAATLGGMCTLIGTSTNLAAHEFARSRGLTGFSMFEFGHVALPMLLVGIAYVFFVGRRFLPSGAVEVKTPERVGEYEMELLVTPDSSWIGRSVRPNSFRRDFDVELVALWRLATPVDLGVSPPHRYQEGDRLRVRGNLENLLELGSVAGLALHRRGQSTQPLPSAAEVKPPLGTLAEFVVLPRAMLIGVSTSSAAFAELFNVTVIALRRPGEALTTPLDQTPIHAGDVLLLEGNPAALHALSRNPGFLHIGSPTQREPRGAKLWIAGMTLGGVVALVTLGLLPIVTAATAGCAVLMLTGCLKPREAYQAIDWSIVFVLAGALALGTALVKTGLAHGLASVLAKLPLIAGPIAVLAAFFLVAVLVSEFLSNSGTVLLLGPIAVTAAEQMGVNPMALVAAITFGSSAAFAMPIGYQTSLMIYGPGGYRFRDFLRMGIVLDLLLAAIALWLIPLHWPLTGN